MLAQIAIGLYGINAPVVWGHYGFHVAEHGLGARNLSRHGTWTHSIHWQPTPPPNSMLNFSHVSMLQPFVAVVNAVFGEAVWIPRAVALSFVLLLLWGIFTFTRIARGDPWALMASAAFVFNPHNGIFCNLADMQVVSMAGTLWVGVGMLQLFRDGPRWTNIALLAGATLLASYFDWPWYPVALFMFAAAFAKLRPYTPLWGKWSKEQIWLARVALFGCCLIILAVFVQHFWRASATGNLKTLSSTYGSRSSKVDDLKFLLDVLTRMFKYHTVTLITLGVAWVAIVVHRRRFDLATLLMLGIFAGQTVYMYIFKRGFLFHEYRGYWFSPVLAFAAADLLIGASHWLRHRFVGRWSQLAATWCIPLAMVGLLLHHGQREITRAKKVAGCLNFSVRGYNPQASAMVAATVVGALEHSQSRIFVDAALGPRIEIWYLIDGDAHQVGNHLSAQRRRQRNEPYLAIVAGGNLRRAGWRQLARDAQVMLIGGVAVLAWRPGIAPSVEHVRVAYTPAFGFVGRWLHAPNPGPRVLVRGDAGVAQRMARTFGSPQSVLDAIRDGKYPMLQRLPSRLRDRTDTR